MRKRHSAQFKAKVALEAAKGEKTVAQLCKQYQVHRVQVQNWKKSLLEALPEVFSTKRVKDRGDSEKLVDELYKQIGQLRVENEWLKKKLTLSILRKPVGSSP